VKNFLELEEMSMGSWTRKKRVECYTPEVLKQIEQDPWNFAPPGASSTSSSCSFFLLEGESQKEVEERMLKFLKEKIIDPLWNEA
jgi:broad specificity phosphatase PhoE